MKLNFDRFGVVPRRSTDPRFKKMSLSQSVIVNKKVPFEPEDEIVIALCVDYISSFFERAKTWTGKQHSYELKHQVERLVGKYVPNGAVMEAARRLGIEMKQTGSNSPNVCFKMKTKRFAKYKQQEGHYTFNFLEP